MPLKAVFKPFRLLIVPCIHSKLLQFYALILSTDLLKLACGFSLVEPIKICLLYHNLVPRIWILDLDVLHVTDTMSILKVLIAVCKATSNVYDN